MISSASLSLDKALLNDAKRFPDLLAVGLLRPVRGSRAMLDGLLGSREDDTEEIACSFHPLCYLSH